MISIPTLKDHYILMIDSNVEGLLYFDDRFHVTSKLFSQLRSPMEILNNYYQLDTNKHPIHQDLKVYYQYQ
jgi:hypothetical protein